MTLFDFVHELSGSAEGRQQLIDNVATNDGRVHE